MKELKKKKPKFKIQTQDKVYSIKKSPLFGLSNKRKLASILYASASDIKKLSQDKNYNVFILKQGNKTREIQEPKTELRKLHARLAGLLCRIEVPDYVHSGIKGRSNISNAKEHLGIGKNLITVDVRKFFPSTKRSHIFDFFYNTLKCSSDIAELLTSLLTYKDKLPTGSQISMPLAYWSNKKMFDEMHCEAVRLNAKMTVYVDDLAFSGSVLNRKFIKKIKSIAKKYVHELHPEKIKFYGPKQAKLVTGVAVINEDIKPRNKHLLEVSESIKELIEGSSKETKKAIVGKLIYLSSIDEKYKDKATSLKSL